MAICIEFELIDVKKTVARYKYGPCRHDLDHVMEFDLEKIVNDERLREAPLHEIITFTSEKRSEFMAYRAFYKIYKHYLEHGDYLKKSGHYA